MFLSNVVAYKNVAYLQQHVTTCGVVWGEQKCIQDSGAET